jgi:hypothetical protein
MPLNCDLMRENRSQALVLDREKITPKRDDDRLSFRAKEQPWMQDAAEEIDRKLGLPRFDSVTPDPAAIIAFYSFRSGQADLSPRQSHKPDGHSIRYRPVQRPRTAYQSAPPGRSPIRYWNSRSYWRISASWRTCCGTRPFRGLSRNFASSMRLQVRRATPKHHPQAPRFENHEGIEFKKGADQSRMWDRAIPFAER